MSTLFLQRPGGTLAYDDTGGDGHLVIMVPGLGDLRHEYRLLAPKLTAAGYRVVTLDLRGHGESSTGWSDYSVVAVGRDILALIEHLNAGPAVIVGTSFAAGAAVWAAAEQPAALDGLVLIGAFVRDHPQRPAQKAVIKVLFAGPWKVRAWDWYYASLYPTQPPADFADYREQLRHNLAEPGRFTALTTMMRLPKADAADRLEQVHAPTLVVMGEKDPDFPDPAAEARFIADRLNGEVLLVPGAGHYPHAEMPNQVAPVLLRFLEQTRG